MAKKLLLGDADGITTSNFYMSVQSLPYHQYALQLLSNSVLVLLSEVLAQQLINLLHTTRYQQNDQREQHKISVMITVNNMSEPVTFMHFVLGQLSH